MTGYLADTNVLSELTKPAPSPEVESFLREATHRVFVSVLSIGEIRKGIAALPSGKRRAVLEDWLANEMMPWFGSRVLPVSLPIAEHWGTLSAERKMAGRPCPVVDAILAATAHVHQLVLATRNERDYQDLGIAIVNPWQPA